MNVLICGIRGFIGSHIAAELKKCGHHVIGGVSSKTPDKKNEIHIDFVKDTDPSNWSGRLSGIDVVINAVGILRDSSQKPMQAIHQDTPIALFEACARAGVKSVIQISALGIAQMDNRYATTKRMADEYLLSLNAKDLLNGVVIRPSVVFGQGGASTALFVGLSKSPFLLLPQPVIRTKIQPVLVTEIAAMVSKLIAFDGLKIRGLIECAGPEPLTIAQFVASLRAQSGKPKAQVFAIPNWMTTWSAKLGDIVPVSPWGSEALSLLSFDNTSDSKAYSDILGTCPAYPDQLLEKLKPEGK